MSLEVIRANLARDKKLVLSVRVRPNAGVNRITGFLSDGSLKISLAAPAVDDKANRALLRLLAKELVVPAANISIISGQTSRHKLVKLRL